MADDQNSKQAEFGPNGAVLTGMSDELRKEYLKDEPVISRRLLRTGGLTLISGLFITAGIFTSGYLWGLHDAGADQNAKYDLIPLGLIGAGLLTDWLGGRLKKRRKEETD